VEFYTPDAVPDRSFRCLVSSQEVEWRDRLRKRVSDSGGVTGLGETISPLDVAWQQRYQTILISSVTSHLVSTMFIQIYTSAV